MPQNNGTLLSEVSGYYSNKLAQHGETPRGVDWNGVESQELRFEQLSKIVNTCSPFSINDLGCGYGAYFDFLNSKYGKIFYCGIDISGDMIRAANERYKDRSDARFIVSSEPDRVADYGIASGIFNVRLARASDEWRRYVEATLEVLDRSSRIGFAFNFLTSYSDAEKMRDNLYYADPCELFDLCKRRYSRHVALLHDYGLYEFTILVRKAP
jgi:SAM-dependent methyltransferase